MTPGTPQVFKLPDLGEGLTEAEVVRWLVAVGDEIQVDQAIVEVETAKSIVEVPSPFAGTVAVLHGAAGETLAVGLPLITVQAAGAPGTQPDTSGLEPADAGEIAAQVYREEEKAGSGNVLIGYGTPDTAHGTRRRRRRVPTTTPGATSGSGGPLGRATPQTPAAGGPLGSSASLPVPTAGDADAPTGTSRPSGQSSRQGETRPTRTVPLVISPLVRALARDHDLDLRLVKASGAGEVITRSDVERAIASPPDPVINQTRKSEGSNDSGFEQGSRRVALSGFRKAVAATLMRSRTEIPEATVWVDVDATRLWDLRESARTETDPGPGLMAYLARFVVAALRQYPVLNSRLDVDRQEVVELDSINLGLAVQTGRGLVVPAVMDAQRLTTSALDTRIRDVTARAREGRSTQDELSAGTFTLNNYGSFRVDGSAAIINHPQVAILGFGRIIDRPWVVEGDIVPRKITQMSFVFDHRVCDGGTAAGFMRSVADAVENPAAAIARL